MKVYYRASQKAGATAVFVPGMVVPAAGWSALFLVILTVLTGLALFPGLRSVIKS